MKQKKLIIGLSVVLAVILIGLGAVLLLNRPKTQTGEKEITVTVVYKDKSEKDFEISTNAEFLGDAVYEEGLVNEEEYKSGFYTVIDGVLADFNADSSWWCVTKDGEMTNVGMNELPILDGDSFEITYTIS